MVKKRKNFNHLERFNSMKIKVKRLFYRKNYEERALN